MNKTDKIIQIKVDNKDTVFGLSESGRLYEYSGDWRLLSDSPKIDQNQRAPYEMPGRAEND